MIHLFYELGVLSRAVAYQNLSGAAVHVGLSQPQLSRIIARLESTYGVRLLDRANKRKSAWTPEARKLSELVQRMGRGFELDLRKIQEAGAWPAELYIGTLEGLLPAAIELAQAVLSQTKIRRIELDVYDLNALEELYLSGDLDLILTSREPGARKFRCFRVLGYQELQAVKTNPKIGVYSLFEYRAEVEGKRSGGPKRLNLPPQCLVSNSLSVRRAWLEAHGGTGHLPSDLRKDRKPTKDDEPVLLIGQDSLDDRIWKLLQKA
jgi:DNA-binding transcriptional LysR family regulator